MSASAQNTRRIAIRAHAAGLVAFGLVGLAFTGLALQYQPVPSVFDTDVVAATSGLFMVGLGMALAWPGAQAWGAAVATAWFSGWILFLHAPRLPWDRLTFGSVLPASEILVVAVGAALLVAVPQAVKRLWLRGWLVAFAAAQVVFGLCHFIYLDITASMIPSILPWPRGWAVLTGAAHLLAAASFLTEFQVRLAATWLCAMYLVFLMAVCVPLVVTRPEMHLHWLMAVITGLHASSAWIVRQSAAVTGERRALI